MNNHRYLALQLKAEYHEDKTVRRDLSALINECERLKKMVETLQARLDKSTKK